MRVLDSMRMRVKAWVNAEPDPSRLADWHQFKTCRPVRLRDGSLSRVGRGQVWRRRVGAEWEYDQDDCYDAGVEALKDDDWN